MTTFSQLAAELGTTTDQLRDFAYTYVEMGQNQTDELRELWAAKRDEAEDETVTGLEEAQRAADNEESATRDQGDEPTARCGV